MPDLPVEDDRRALGAAARRAGRPAAPPLTWRTGSRRLCVIVGTACGRFASASSICRLPPRQVTARDDRPVGNNRRGLPGAYVITGPSGVGKGTLIRALCARIPELELSTSATTRPPRRGERDGVDYHFLEPVEFARRVEAGEFLEHATYSGNRYGTLRSEVEERTARGAPVLLEIEVQGARQVRESMPEATQIFIAPPDAADLRRRLEGRGTDSPETIAARLAVAVEELAARREFSHTVVNDDVERATEELEAIVRSG